MKLTTNPIMPGLLACLLPLGVATASANSWVQAVAAREFPPLDDGASWICGTSDTLHGGGIRPVGHFYAAAWNRHDGSMINLHPIFVMRWGSLVPAGQSEVFDTAGEQQVGWVQAAHDGAALWSGTAESYVDLHPEGARFSWAVGTDGSRQVGAVAWTTTLADRAGIWSSTPDSFVSLHPEHASRSIATSISGGSQGGMALIAGQWHAAIWRNTPESFVDLHPDGFGFSIVEDVHHGEAVGDVRDSFGGESRAARWSGSADNYQSLHPEGAVSSAAYATVGDYHVGRADFGSGSRGLVWMSGADSCLDLHQALDTARFTASSAYSIRKEGLRLIIGGSATTGGEPHAMEWIVTLSDTGMPEIESVEVLLSDEHNPDSDFVDVAFEVIVTDDSGDAHWYVEHAESNRPGHDGRDLLIVGDNTLRVHHERCRRKNPRIITVTLRAIDAAGNLSEPASVSFQLEAARHSAHGILPEHAHQPWTRRSWRGSQSGNGRLSPGLRRHRAMHAPSGSTGSTWH